MGVYLRTIRPGRVLEATAIGVVLLLAAVIGGGLIDDTGLGEALTLSKEWLVLALVVYGFVASVLPVWLLLTPRDYLSTFMKIGVIVLLAVGLLLARPVLQADAVSEFAREGTGPVFAGSLFPFVFITIACGALSGFHALISSGTTPKMVAKESQVRLIGYGGMLMESFVAISALIAAVVIDQGLYFAMNAPAGVTGGTAESAAAYVNGLGFDTTAQDLAAASAAIQEPSLVSRTGGAPTLAVGIANILSQAFGTGMAAFWYHFAIMFEALFILTAVDAGTRVGRFMLQDTIGNVWKRFGDLSWRPGNIMASAVVVALWGYILYVGVTDPLGGVNQLFPLFGIANQLLAGIALTLVTVLLIKHGKAKYAWVTGIPLAWDLIITMTASWQKVFSADPRVGYFAQRQRYADAQAAGELLAPAQSAEQMDRIIYNSTLNGVLQAVFALLVLVVVVNAVVVIARALRARGAVPTTEEPAVPSSIVEPSGLFATAEEKRAMAEQERLVGAGTRGHGTFTEEGPSR
jgi:carbon starvation protein